MDLLPHSILSRPRPDNSPDARSLSGDAPQGARESTTVLCIQVSALRRLFDMKRNAQIYWSSLVIGHALLSNHGSTLPEPGVEAVDLGMLLLDLLDGAAAGVVRRLGMIGDADIAITTGEAGLRHCLERIGPSEAVVFACKTPRNPRLPEAEGSRGLRLARSRPGPRAVPALWIAGQALHRSRPLPRRHNLAAAAKPLRGEPHSHCRRALLQGLHMPPGPGSKKQGDPEAPRVGGSGRSASARPDPPATLPRDHALSSQTVSKRTTSKMPK